MTLRGKPDMADLGNAVHAFLAGDRADYPNHERLAMARQALERWGVASTLEAAELVAAGEALLAWLAQRWPYATVRREWPVMRKMPDGAVMTGVADLVVASEEGVAILDHKVISGTTEAAMKGAGKFRGQLAAYLEAHMEIAPNAMGATFVHLPLNGLICELD
jgi:hypothetical protein